MSRSHVPRWIAILSARLYHGHAMAQIATTYQYLSRKPGSLYHQLFIKDRWIAARTLYGLSLGEDAMTPHEIAADYNLPLAAALEAISYCQSDPPEIPEDYAAEEAVMEASGMNKPDYKYRAQPQVLSAEEMARLNRL
jgi:uncharacterized protein (DUF433 family)